MILKFQGVDPAAASAELGATEEYWFPSQVLGRVLRGPSGRAHGMGKGSSTFISTSETVGICDRIGQRLKAPRKAPHCFPAWWLCLSKQGETVVPCAEEVCSQWCQLEDNPPRCSWYWSWASDACRLGAVCEIYFITRALFCLPRPPQLLYCILHSLIFSSEIWHFGKAYFPLFICSSHTQDSSTTSRLWSFKSPVKIPSLDSKIAA